MSNFDIVQLIIEVVILILLLYVAFLKSYFTEKGKNLATKEDIEEITGLVESVKSQVQYSLQAKISFRELERDALIDYFSKYHTWLAAIVSHGSACTGEEDTLALIESRSRLEELERDFDLATGKMELFVENSDILLGSTQLKIATLELLGHAIRCGYEVQRAYLSAKWELSQTPIEEKFETTKIAMEKRSDMYTAYKAEQLERYKKLFPKVNAHRSAISKHLRELIDQ